MQANWQDLVKKHVAEQVAPFAQRISELESIVTCLSRRISDIEAQVNHLKTARDGEAWEKTARNSSPKLANCKTEMSDVCEDSRHAQGVRVNSLPHVVAPGFLTLSDEALSLILSHLPLRSPFMLHQCCRALRSDFCARSHLMWTCISDFISVQTIRSDLVSSAASSLYQWASRKAAQVSATDGGLDISHDECNQEEHGRQVTYEICLDGCMALNVSRSYLASVYDSPQMANIIKDILEEADCRLCRRSSTGFRSEGSGGHSNRYEAEFVIHTGDASSSDQVRLGINVCKYYNESECGWDEGLDVNCYFDGREVLNLRRDGSDEEYDENSLNRGLLHQLASQLLIPSSEPLILLTLLWRILCAPLLACSQWDEEKPRFGLGLPHRKDSPSMFCTLGAMFAKLAESATGPNSNDTLELTSHLLPDSRSERVSAETHRFLKFVLER